VCARRWAVRIAGTRPLAAVERGEFDWDEMFGKLGARWLHTGEVFCALSDTTPDVAIEGMQAARKHGVVVSLVQREALRERNAHLLRGLAREYVEIVKNARTAASN
jgi:hypothetical protein